MLRLGLLYRSTICSVIVPQKTETRRNATLTTKGIDTVMSKNPTTTTTPEAPPEAKTPSGSVAAEQTDAARTEATEEEQTTPDAPGAASEAADTEATEPASAKAKKPAGSKKAKAKRSPRSRNLMYEQQLSHFPPHIKDLDDLEKRIEDVLQPEQYAVILHDKDMNEKGKPAEDHCHAFMVFRNPRSCASIAKLIGDKPQTVTVWDDRANNGFMYLIHATDKAKAEGKYQYDPAAVRANFDYSALVESTTKEVKKAQTYGDNSRTKTVLDMVYAGVITKQEAESQLPGHVLGRVKRQLDDVHAKYLERAAAEWRKDMIAQGKTVKVIWFYGSSGTGKTSAAKALAEKTGQPYYISGSTRDIFQAYEGQHTIILDELRAQSMPYADLLRILDPYSINGEVMAPSRYNDKALACDLFLITSPYSPRAFYNDLFQIREGQRDDSSDSFEQLLRRITLAVCMTDAEMMVATYDNVKKYFVPDKSTSKPNPYSTASRPAPAVNAADLFEKMFS